MTIKINNLIGDSITVTSQVDTPSSEPTPLPFLAYDSNRCIIGPEQDETISIKVEADLDNDGINDGNVYFLKDQNSTFTDKYALGVCDNAFFIDSTCIPDYTGPDNLKSISLPNAIEIGDMAFWYTGLEQIQIPQVTTIGDSAFGWTKISSIELPNVTSIGGQAFDWCQQLMSVTLPNSGNIEICSWAFSHCNNLISITLPSGMKSISTGVFSGCSSLSSITLPSSLTEIGELAFEKCGLLDLTIPPNVSQIYSGAFYGCNSLLILDLSQNTNYSVEEEVDLRMDWSIPEGATIIFHDSPTA